MSNNIVVGAAVLAALLPVAASAQSPVLPEGVNATVGLRVWNTRWSTWFEFDRAGGNVAANQQARVEHTLIPVVSLRYQRFFVSGSYLAKREFEFNAVTKFDRREYDINFGYFILPGLAATIGWKHLDYDGGGYDWDAKGPTVGLSGNAPISPAISVYGNFAYGWPKLDDNGAYFDDKRGKYLFAELGLAFPLGQMHDSMGGFVATAGYRYQRVGAHYNSPLPALRGLQTEELFEYTQGPIVGISATF